MNTNLIKYAATGVVLAGVSYLCYTSVYTPLQAETNSLKARLAEVSSLPTDTTSIDKSYETVEKGK